MYTCSFALTSIKQKTGSNVYYVPDIDVNSNANISMSKDDEATFTVFLEIIKSENDEIVSLWKTAKTKKPTSIDGDTATVIKTVEADPIEVLSK